MKSLTPNYRVQHKIRRMKRRETVAKKRPPSEFAEIEGVAPIMDLQPSQLRELSLLFGDEQLARRVILLAERFPLATLPELVVYDWLTRKHYEFTYQGQFAGGRMMHGGAVPDFVVNWGGYGLVLRVQGDYWHTLPGQKEKDVIQRLQMIGQYINGLRVKAVVDLWESDIYRRREFVMQMAMAGVGVRE